MLVNAQPTFYSIMNSSTAQKLLLENVHLNDHILGFYPQTRTLEPPFTTWWTVPQEIMFTTG